MPNCIAKTSNKRVQNDALHLKIHAVPLWDKTITHQNHSHAMTKDNSTTFKNTKMHNSWQTDLQFCIQSYLWTTHNISSGHSVLL